MRIWLSTILLLISLLIAILLTPLSVWRSLAEPYFTAHSLKLRSLDGQIWNGSADISPTVFSSSTINGIVSLAWQFSIWPSPISIQLEHADFHAEGRIKPSFQALSLELDTLTISSKMANMFLRRQGVVLTGDNIVVNNLALLWNYNEKLPARIKAEGYWDGGSVRYPVGKYRRSVQFDAVNFDIISEQSEPYLMMRSKQGVSYLTAKINTNGEGEATLMPAFLAAIGQTWHGDKDTPALVLTERIF